jgi:hypothetical protein
MGAVFSNAPNEPAVVAIYVMRIYFDAPCPILPGRETRDHERAPGRLCRASDGRVERLRCSCGPARREGAIEESGNNDARLNSELLSNLVDLAPAALIDVHALEASPGRAFRQQDARRATFHQASRQGVHRSGGAGVRLFRTSLHAAGGLGRPCHVATVLRPGTAAFEQERERPEGPSALGQPNCRAA